MTAAATLAPALQDLPSVRPDRGSNVFTAASRTHPGVTHTLGVTAGPGGQLRISCTCPAGVHARPDRRPIPCRHARAVAAHLAADGLAVPDQAGGWVLVGDPFPAPAADELEADWLEGFVVGVQALAETLTAQVCEPAWVDEPLAVIAAATARVLA